MADIGVIWVDDLALGDWSMDGADLAGGDDVVTSALISVFTDQVAQADDVIPDAPPGQVGDPRGWWGDAGADYPIGSRLWLVLERAKQTSAVLTAAKDALTSCLQWMIDDGVLAAVDVNVWYPRLGWFAAKILLIRKSGAETALAFETAVGGG